MSVVKSERSLQESCWQDIHHQVVHPLNSSIFDRPQFIHDQLLYELRLEASDFGRKLAYLRLGVLEESDRNKEEERSSEPRRWRKLDGPDASWTRFEYLARLAPSGKKRRLLCITQSAGIGKSTALQQLSVARSSNPGHMTIRLHFSEVPENWKFFLEETDSIRERPLLVDYVMRRFEKKSERYRVSSMNEECVEGWLRSLIRTGRFTLAIDGLDEVPTHDWQEEIVYDRKRDVSRRKMVDRGAIAKAKALRDLIDHYPRLHCAVAGRPNAINEVTWSHLFASRPGPNHDETSEWEFCLTSIFNDRQRLKVLGRTRYDQLELLQGEIQFNARTLEVLRVLEPAKFQTIRSTADAYWYGIDRSISLDRKKEGVERPVIPLDKREILDILSAIAIVFTMWNSDPIVPRYRQSRADSTETQIPKVITEVESFNQRVVRRLGRIHKRWAKNDYEIAKEKLRLLRALGTQYVEFRFLAADDPLAVAWRDANQRDFFAALWMVRSSSAEERDWLCQRVSVVRDDFAQKSKSKHVDLVDLWRFLCGMNDGALVCDNEDPEPVATKEDRWLACIRVLFLSSGSRPGFRESRFGSEKSTTPLETLSQQSDRPRPTELMYRCWPNLLRRSGFLRTEGWTDEELQSATEQAQKRFDPKRTRNVSSQATNERTSGWISGLDILREFLGKYPSLRDGNDDRAII